MTDPEADDLARWAARAPRVDEDWFVRGSRLHGVRHTQRVHIHAERLVERLGWPGEDAQLVLRAALWHDIGRTGDGVEPSHGAGSAARADELGLAAKLAPADAAVVRFAIVRHSLADRGAGDHARDLARHSDDELRLTEPERALRILWLLKDADALDRVRLGFGERADPRQLRHAETIGMIGFAEALFDALG